MSLLRSMILGAWEPMGFDARGTATGSSRRSSGRCGSTPEATAGPGSAVALRALLHDEGDGGSPITAGSYLFRSGDA